MLKSLQEESFRIVVIANNLSEQIRAGEERKNSLLRTVTVASRLLHKIDTSSDLGRLRAVAPLMDCSTYYTEALIWLNLFITDGLLEENQARELGCACREMIEAIKTVTEQMSREAKTAPL